MRRGQLLLAGALALLAAATVGSSGCTRGRYRLAADEEVGHLVLEKSDDPRWCMPDFTIEMDPRSRFYDPWDRDYPPMPPDDAHSHKFMHYVDCMKGWPRWHEHGDIDELENPYWMSYLGQYLEQGEN